MQYVFLDGARIHSNADLHAVFAAELALEAYYGGNLDALYDVLTDRTEPLGIVIVNETLLREHLGSRANGFFRLLRDLQADNAVRVTVVSQNEPET